MPVTGGDLCSWPWRRWSDRRSPCWLVSPPAAAYPAASVSFEGHGYGHGHGMGQWGALGYALGGTDYRSILDHFYGGTTVSGLSSGQESTSVRVAAHRKRREHGDRDLGITVLGGRHVDRHPRRSGRVHEPLR